MLLKNLADLTRADIENLRANSVHERRFIDHKSSPVGGKDEDKKEFLADVSAVANASGSDIILGVRDKEGQTEEIVGVELEDVDKEKLRLGDLIRTGLEPQLSIVDMQWLTMGQKRGVLIVRVPRSWAAPHRVTLRGHMRFYVRNSAGKRPMNVDDLRQAFSLAETVVITTATKPSSKPSKILLQQPARAKEFRARITIGSIRSSHSTRCTQIGSTRFKRSHWR